MKTTRVKKNFDCVEFKREAQTRIYERIKDLSPEEEISYFRKAAEGAVLGEAWNAARDRAKQGRSAALRGGQDS